MLKKKKSKLKKEFAKSNKPLKRSEGQHTWNRLALTNEGALARILPRLLSFTRLFIYFITLHFTHFILLSRL
jgi:hypothetical protein